MFIRCVSDIHMESWNPEYCDSGYVLHPLDSDSETILLLCGDIVTVKTVGRYARFFEEISSRFMRVLYIPGNHEYYGGNLPTTSLKIKDALSGYDNIEFNEQINFVHGDYNFVGTTYWTDFDKFNPIVMNDVSARYGGLNDYFTIKNNGKLLPRHIFEIHKRQRQFIVSNIRPDKKNIVFTHHAPSVLSISPKFRGDRLNYAYVSSHEDLIDELSPVLWFHGHVHDFFDYGLFNTRVICNPYGYDFVHGREVSNYDPKLLIQI